MSTPVQWKRPRTSTPRASASLTTPSPARGSRPAGRRRPCRCRTQRPAAASPAAPACSRSSTRSDALGRNAVAEGRDRGVRRVGHDPARPAPRCPRRRRSRPGRRTRPGRAARPACAPGSAEHAVAIERRAGVPVASAKDAASRWRSRARSSRTTSQERPKTDATGAPVCFRRDGGLGRGQMDRPRGGEPRSPGRRGPAAA